MRFVDKVQLITRTDEVYNQETGNYEPGEEVTRDLPALVNDMSRDYQALYFGGFRKGALTIRFKNQVKVDFDTVQIIEGQFKSDKKYKVIEARALRGKTSLQVEEKL